ncbi:hypothetical protein M3Y98_00064200 [Aphelenchoides besseyi]|nr:hypothetical protein M3Y98_00064200 [Aphelenchoides besseyi]KAI6198825.1 hypothetical protein M3Y96_00560500 [Aphelenchoides besseyi]
MLILNRFGPQFSDFVRSFRPFRCLSTKTADPKEIEAAAGVAESDVVQMPSAEELNEENESQELQRLKLPYNQKALATLKLDQYPFYVEREWWKYGKRMTFWATWRMLRDVKRRKLLAELGPERMRLKALQWNTVLPQAIRDECADKLFNMPKYSHPSLILNMCQFTGRQRGKIKPYRVNRHIFRRLADHGQLSGVQRAVW